MALTKCRAIVIKTVHYSESSVVLKCFTDKYGLQSYMVNGVRSKKGSIRNSQLQPLTLLELETYHQENKNLKRIKELKCFPMLRHIHYEVIHSAVGIFISELLNKCIREEDHTDLPLFEFLFHSIQILDIENETLANFPAYFMLQLTRYLGFFPKGEYSDSTNSLDIREGYFTFHDHLNSFHLGPELSVQISQLLKTDFRTLGTLRLSRDQRHSLIGHLTTFYSIHISGFGEMRSNKVLNEVLS
ncbi:MAG: DNA repair protein RecO [Bacteroidia bacterium]